MALGKFQMQGFKSWKGLTKSNHISAMFATRPQEASSVVMRMLEHNYGKSLDSYLSKFPIKYFDEDNDFTWKLMGSSRRNVPIYEARDIEGNVLTTGMAGVNTEPFYVVFSEDMFFDGEVIVGEKNEVYPLRILGDPTYEGTLSVYKVELMGGVRTGMPVEELLFGKRFSVEFAPVEKELSRKVGGVRYNAPISMRNEFSRVRIYDKVPGNMLDKKLGISIPMTNAKGETASYKTWMHYEDFQLEAQFSEYKNHVTMYGTSNRTSTGEYFNLGKSGNILQTGAGIREQMSYANQNFYNTFSLKLIEDMLYELSTGKIEYRNRTFILDTGERGAALFSKAVQEKASGWNALNYFGGNGQVNVIQNTTSEYHTNSLSAGFQFTEYRAPMGITIKINVNPMYDDPVRNKIYHPDGGVAESYRFDIYDIGSMSAPNIQLARVKGQEDIRGIQRGLRDPFTGVSGGDIAYDEDSSTIHKMAVLGALIYDPNRTVSLIPAILA